MKLGKTLKNMNSVLAKVVRKSVFGKLKFAGSLMKKRSLFPSKICPIF